MKSWSEFVFFILLGLSILALPILGWAIIDTQVSIKYELDKPSDCVSSVTSIDLCSRLQTLESLVVISILTIVVLLIFRKWFFAE
jgi:hypothetical protein